MDTDSASVSLLQRGIADLSVDRKVLVTCLDARIQRAQRCRAVPRAVLIYVIFIVALLVRMPVYLAFEFERGLIDSVVNNNDQGAYYPTTHTEWYAWLSNDLLPTVMSNKNAAGSELPPNRRGRILNGLGLIIGGVRLVQTRLAEGPCSLPLDGRLESTYGIPCYDSSTRSLAGGFGNMTAAEESGVSAAFFAREVPGDLLTTTGFDWIISTNLTLEDATAQVAGLQTSSWLDDATASVAVQFVVLNGQLGLWAWVGMRTDFTRGGRGVPSYTVGNVPVQPYWSFKRIQFVIILCDLIMMGYWLYMVVGCSRRVAVIVGGRKRLAAKLWSLVAWWQLVDYGVVAALLTSVISWGFVVWECYLARNVIAGGLSSESYSAGPSGVQEYIFSALRSIVHFKEGAVVTLVALTARLFKYFKHQPRLAVLTDAIGMGLGDSLSFGLLIGVLLCMFGTWGHFMFGSQAKDWHTSGLSIPSVIRFMMYDYDLSAMTATYPAMAYTFYISFMIIIVNLVLWMFLAFILESYSIVRQESLLGPSLWDDFNSTIAAVPNMFPASTRRLCSCRSKPGISWADVISAARTGSLSDSESISVNLLVRVMQMEPTDAFSLLHGVIAECEQKALHEQQLQQLREQQSPGVYPADQKSPREAGVGGRDVQQQQQQPPLQPSRGVVFGASATVLAQQQLRQHQSEALEQGQQHCRDPADPSSQEGRPASISTGRGGGSVARSSSASYNAVEMSPARYQL